MIAFAGLVCSGGREVRAADGNHAEKHAEHSYVLVLKSEAIARGPDFSQRASALEYGKKNHLRDLVWFATDDAAFLAADAETIRKLKEFEKPQTVLEKRWRREGGDSERAQELSRLQKQHTLERDEFVWALFDKLKTEGRLTKVNRDHPRP